MHVKGAENKMTGEPGPAHDLKTLRKAEEEMGRGGAVGSGREREKKM